LLILLLMLAHPPISTLFPYTTLFRSLESIFDECDQFDSHETGGRLIGSYEQQKDGKYDVRLLGVIGPGPNAERSATSFFQDGERSEEHTSELQSHLNLVCRLLLEKKN